MSYSTWVFDLPDCYALDDFDTITHVIEFQMCDHVISEGYRCTRVMLEFKFKVSYAHALAWIMVACSKDDITNLRHIPAVSNQSTQTSQ